MSSSSKQATYRIVVRGTLSERLEHAFDGMAIERGTAGTTLVGDLADQAALFGMIERVRDLGLDLVRVEEAE